MRRAPVLRCTPALALALGCALAACGQDRGSWPSLAPRPSERRSVAPDPVVPAAAEVPPAQAAEPAIPADPAAPAAFMRLRPRVTVARTALTRALGAAARAMPASEPWAAAETELSRAEQLLGELDDLLPRFGDSTHASLAAAEARAARDGLARQIEAAKRALAR